MDKIKCLEILHNSIDQYPLYHDKKDDHADNGLHIVIGKIGLAVELGLINFDEMDYFIDAIFEKYSLIQKE